MRLFQQTTMCRLCVCVCVCDMIMPYGQIGGEEIVIVCGQPAWKVCRHDSFPCISPPLSPLPPSLVEHSVSPDHRDMQIQCSIPFMQGAPTTRIACQQYFVVFISILLVELTFDRSNPSFFKGKIIVINEHSSLKVESIPMQIIQEMT